MQAVVTKMLNVESKIPSIESIKSAIAKRIDFAAYNSWIEPLDFNVTGDTLFLTAQNQFSADYISSVHMGVLNSVLEEFNLIISLDVLDNSSSISNANDNKSNVFVPAELITVKKDDIGFDKFVVSDDNSFVVSACKKMADGAASFSPLFIYGTEGCGKSLLAECINSQSNGRTLMMNGGQFVSEFLRSMREHTIFAFKDFCRNCDTFIMDDLQFLAGKRASMEEFQQLILDLTAQNKNIVLIANAAPASLGGFDRRMQSLFASGLVADIAAPDKNVKKRILVRCGVALDVAESLSTRISGNGHLITGISMKIRTYTELMDEKVTLDIAEKLLSDVLQKSKTPVSMVKEMCEKLGVSYTEVCSPRRNRTIVRARQIMMTALKISSKLSLTEIGRLVGDRDHATVLYSISQVEKMQKSDLILVAEIDQMVAECR